MIPVKADREQSHYQSESLQERFHSSSRLTVFLPADSMLEELSSKNKRKIRVIEKNKEKTSVFLHVDAFTVRVSAEHEDIKQKQVTWLDHLHELPAEPVSSCNNLNFDFFFFLICVTSCLVPVRWITPEVRNKCPHLCWRSVQRFCFWLNYTY